jgi:hypothetical protein
MSTPPKLLLATLLLVSAAAAFSAPPPAAEDPAWLFAAAESGVRMVERDGAIGLANPEVALLVRKQDGTLLGIWPKGRPNLVRLAPPTPLWSMELAAPGADKPVVVAAAPADKLSFVATGDAQARTLEMTVDRTEGKVILRMSLAADSALVRWRIEVTLAAPDARLWSVTFPQLSVAALDADPAQNEMVVPYRRGQLRQFGRGFSRADISLPYPGPSAKFQFLAAYGRTAGRGLYFAAEDGAGLTKSFITRNYPQADAVGFGIQHFPADRGTGVKQFALPYDIVAGPFTGDWWHAARLYRQWWVKQEWAGRGLLARQRDLPDWLLRAPFVTRPSTTKPARTVENNRTGLRLLSEAVAGKPFFGIWYGPMEKPGGSESLDEGGHGHLLPPKAGLVEAVREARGRGIHLQAYLQSIIYDDTVPASDAAIAERAITRGEKGGLVAYGTGERTHLKMMCRATDWWQQRMVDLSRRAVAEWGFSGVYLDSFGKGATECFAPGHGHPIGGGNTVVAGQRTMARKIREVIRAADPQAVMSGEDPIEAFRDLLDVNLYAVNVTPGYAPIYRTVWGDYSLGHGRVIGPGPALIPELASMFLEGTIPGRIYSDSPKPFLLQPELATEFAFMKSLLAYTDHGLAWLRMGEYLHPLELSPAPAVVEFRESVENQVVRLPGVLHSVTRSHADGSVAIVLVNITGSPQTLKIPIDPSLLGAPRGSTAVLARMDQTGARQEISTRREPWSQPLTLAPLETAFLILKSQQP